jgi:hypothetical protein
VFAALDGRVKPAHGEFKDAIPFNSKRVLTQTIAEALDALAGLFQRLVGGGVGDAEE